MTLRDADLAHTDVDGEYGWRGWDGGMEDLCSMCLMV